ncbi:PREDICTED: uncharacterized protein LOC109167977 [Ipomoea nil]|uniref:uncharacterized protein LOC109167977 n=1 Tax=Ipomoea nil TaxID=35883 RepID=UPI000901B208|nr:PREDICTED: uncharacterized protein LOC109167977 [Ipomoea nil]
MTFLINQTKSLPKPNPHPINNSSFSVSEAQKADDKVCGSTVAGNDGNGGWQHGGCSGRGYVDELRVTNGADLVIMNSDELGWFRVRLRKAVRAMSSGRWQVAVIPTASGSKGCRPEKYEIGSD